ncbi:hypothetical protein Tco_1355719, partial [Tanacetum coccineum]
AINKAILAHNLDCRQEAQDEKNAYIELIDTSMKAIIKEEVNTQIPQTLPQAVSDFANPVIAKNITESLEAAVLTRTSSQPKSTYKAATSLSEFELTKILQDEMEESNHTSKSFSKLVTLSLNLNTEEKSRREVNKVVASKVVGVRVSVACCGRGLKNRGGGGIVVMKLDVVSGTVIA